MIIEIRNAGFVNKGAELMLCAITQKIKDRYPSAKLVMAPSHPEGNRPIHKLMEAGFSAKAWLWRSGIQWGDLARVVPSYVRDMYGLVLDSQVDVVLDASGFLYGDQWGIGSSKEFARASRRWKKRGTKIILLPQAFGTYKKKNIASFVRDWAFNADLIFARERESYDLLTAVVGKEEKIRISPDFTNLVVGTLPDNFDRHGKRVAVVPNHRMIDKTSEDEGDAYVPFLIRCVNLLKMYEAKPFLLVHEGERDEALASRISAAVGGVPVVKESDPLKIKGILGGCDATIGGRFHGLVSALSQGVPSLATGWSHKYAELMKEYGVEDGLIAVHASEAELQQRLGILLNPDISHPLRVHLTERSRQLKAMSEHMWELVFAEIDQVSSKAK